MCSTASGSALETAPLAGARSRATDRLSISSSIPATSARCTAPGSPETWLLEWRQKWLVRSLAPICLLILDRWNIADRLQEAVVIEPPDPIQCRKFYVLKPAPGALTVDHLRLKEADDRLG